MASSSSHTSPQPPSSERTTRCPPKGGLGRVLGPVLATCVLASPGLAHAANTNQPRVPPSFLGAACIGVVDRSVDPVWRFDVGIPFEDTSLGPDEPPDGRTFQFFALCRQPGPLEALPPWITAADAETASMFDPTIELPAAGEPLDESPTWQSCVEPITTAAERMPISCEATMDGAAWDATGVPAGAYAVWGYTYEPVQSLWTPRDGVVRVIDGDDASAGPAVSFAWPLTDVDAGLSAGIRIAGCVSGMPGTTVTVSWATAAALSEQGDAAWQTLAELPDPQPTFELAFVPPASAEFEAVFLRAEAIDPQGRSFVAFTRDPIVFLSGCDEPTGGARSLPDACRVGSGSPPIPEGTRDGGGCEGESSGGLDESGDDSGPGQGASTSATDETGGAPADADTGGCGCRHAPGRSLAWLVLLAFLRPLRARQSTASSRPSRPARPRPSRPSP